MSLSWASSAIPSLLTYLTHNRSGKAVLEVTSLSNDRHCICNRGVAFRLYALLLCLSSISRMYWMSGNPSGGWIWYMTDDIANNLGHILLDQESFQSNLMMDIVLIGLGLALLSILACRMHPRRTPYKQYQDTPTTTYIDVKNREYNPNCTRLPPQPIPQRSCTAIHTSEINPINIAPITRATIRQPSRLAPRGASPLLSLCGASFSMHTVPLFSCHAQ